MGRYTPQINEKIQRLTQEATEAKREADKPLFGRFLGEFGRNVQQVGQAIGRSLTVPGAVFEETIATGKFSPHAKFDPQTEFQQLITGRDQPFGFTDLGRENLEVFDLREETIDNLAFPVGVAIAGLDVVPIGGGGKGRIIKHIAKSDNVAKIFTFLKRAAPRQADDVLKRSAAELVGVTDRAVIKTKVDDLIRTTPPRPRTPLVQRPRPSGGPDMAGNIRLDKFNISAPARVGLANVIERNQGFIRQRRGIQPHAYTEALAQDMPIKKDLSPGTTLNAEEMKSYGDAVAGAGVRTDELARRITKGDNADQTLLAFEIAKNEQGALLASYAGARAEAGRSLNILGQINNPKIMNDADLLKKALAITGGDPEKIARQIVSFAPDDIIGKYRYLRSLQKSGAADWASWYWYNNLLSGPKTQIRNILGNTSNMTAYFTARPFAGIVDYLDHFVRGKPREVFVGEIKPAAAGFMVGVREGWQKAMFMWKNGFTMDDVAALDFRPPEVFDGTFPNIIGRSLEAFDLFFRNINASTEKYAMAFAAAKRRGLAGDEFVKFFDDFVTDPPVSAIKQIADEGSRSVFRAKPGQIGSAIIKLKSDFKITINGVERTFFNPMKFVMPFVLTPLNIIKVSFDFTPVGFFTALTRQTPRARRLAQGRAAFGSLALLPLAVMASEGRVSGSGPQDKELRDLLYSTGWQPNSIRIGDKWYNYSNFQPLALPLSLVANSFEAWHYQGQEVDEDIFGLILAKAFNSLTQQSYLRGLFTVQRAIENPEVFGGQLIRDIMRAAIPLSAAQGQLTRAVDETVRAPETLGEDIKAQTPGLSQQVRPRLSALGEEATRETGLGEIPAFLSNFLSPVDIRETRTTPLKEELLRLQDQVQIGFPSKTITIKNKKIELTPDEQTELLKIAGEAIKKRLEKAMESTRWENLPDEKKVEFIEDVVREERKKARAKLIRGTERIKEELKKR